VKRTKRAVSIQHPTQGVPGTFPTTVKWRTRYSAK